MEDLMPFVRLLFRVCAAATAAGLAAAMQGAACADPIAYARDIGIDVALTQPISSQTARVGDRFAFETTADYDLGTVELPAGTQGTGRVAAVVRGTRERKGMVALQADNLVAFGTIVWVNIDPSIAPHGVPVAQRDMLVRAGAKFVVTTIVQRSQQAPLVRFPSTVGNGDGYGAEVARIRW